MFQKLLLKNFIKSFNTPNSSEIIKLVTKDISKKKQEPFINLVNIIIDSKEKIAKYNKHLDSLNAVDKIEKLESLVKNSIEKIDSMVYGLYGLSNDEIGII